MASKLHLFTIYLVINVCVSLVNSEQTTYIKGGLIFSKQSSKASLINPKFISHNFSLNFDQVYNSLYKISKFTNIHSIICEHTLSALEPNKHTNVLKKTFNLEYRFIGYGVFYNAAEHCSTHGGSLPSVDKSIPKALLKVAKANNLSIFPINRYHHLVVDTATTFSSDGFLKISSILSKHKHGSVPFLTSRNASNNLQAFREGFNVFNMSYNTYVRTDSNIINTVTYYTTSSIYQYNL